MQVRILLSSQPSSVGYIVRLGFKSKPDRVSVRQLLEIPLKQIFMITIKRNEQQVIILFEEGPLMSTYTFSVNCGDEYYASLLSDHFRRKLSNRIETIRKEEYERGYKDGRGKQGKKSWFFSTFKIGGY
jgi:hypothetical protein